jgi:hypothetical protein
MQRGSTGQYRTTSTLGETVRAFVPHPLPLEPPLAMEAARQGVLAIAVPEDRCTHGSEYLVHFVHVVYVLDYIVVFNIVDKLEPFIYATCIAHVRVPT